MLQVIQYLLLLILAYLLFLSLIKHSIYFTLKIMYVHSHIFQIIIITDIGIFTFHKSISIQYMLRNAYFWIQIHLMHITVFNVSSTQHLEQTHKFLATEPFSDFIHIMISCTWKTIPRINTAKLSCAQHSSIKETKVWNMTEKEHCYYHSNSMGTLTNLIMVLMQGMDLQNFVLSSINKSIYRQLLIFQVMDSRKFMDNPKPRLKWKQSKHGTKWI
jgi:hypothetical protein